jgi:hypothetical protein
MHVHGRHDKMHHRCQGSQDTDQHEICFIPCDRKMPMGTTFGINHMCIIVSFISLSHQLKLQNWQDPLNSFRTSIMSRSQIECCASGNWNCFWTFTVWSFKQSILGAWPWQCLSHELNCSQADPWRICDKYHERSWIFGRQIRKDGWESNI